MKPLRSLSVLAVLLAVVGSSPLALGQGSIVPTGTPGPTMKTLDQVEARIPIPGGTTGFTPAPAARIT